MNKYGLTGAEIRTTSTEGYLQYPLGIVIGPPNKRQKATYNKAWQHHP